MPVEFICQDCNAHVSDFGAGVVPVPPRCQVCRWVAEVPDGPERAALAAALRLPVPVPVERIQGHLP